MKISASCLALSIFLNLRILIPALSFSPSSTSDAPRSGVSTSTENLSPASSSSAAGTATPRRTFVVKFAHAFLGVICSTYVLPQQNAYAKESQQAEADKQKLLEGYRRLNYLLDNWEKETTVCGTNDNPYTGKKGCDRTPLKVMEYLGYKSMEDPLFKADKTMKRLEAFVPPDREGDFLDAMETWAQVADEASGMAYVSSWGEANPGGGKDRVEEFIERSKNNVIDARNCLATVIDILKIS